MLQILVSCFWPGRSAPILVNYLYQKCRGLSIVFKTVIGSPIGPTVRRRHLFKVKKRAVFGLFWPKNLWINTKSFLHPFRVRIWLNLLYVFCRGLWDLSKTVFRSMIGLWVWRRDRYKVDPQKRVKSQIQVNLGLDMDLTNVLGAPLRSPNSP